MYTSKPSFIYGFHGLDKEIAFRILTQQEDFKHSNNHYDWLGHGVYFWENNYERAVQYAIETSKRKSLQ
jgi:ribulose-5-phosphate 4-epimerase/fuculose-1-phosphate aldolase